MKKKDSKISYRHPPSKEVQNRAKIGAKWSILLALFRQILLIGTTMVVSRHVTPTQYGVGALALTTLAFLILLDTGLTWASVQSTDLDSERYSSLFYFGILLGGALWLAASLLSGPIASYFNIPELAQHLKLIGAATFFSCIASQPVALLRRELRQKELGVFETISLLTSAIIAITLARAGMGTLAIVGQAFSYHLARALIVLGYKKGLPKLPRDFRCAVPEIRKGLGFAASNYICFFQLYLGGLLVGKFLGPSDLGHYHRANAVKSMPTQYAAMTVTDVMVSSLAALKQDTTELSRLYHLALSKVAFVGCAAGSFLFIGADEVIHILYGAQWAKSAMLLKWFAFAAVALPISTSTIWLFLATGNARSQLQINLVLTTLSVGALSTTFLWFRDLERLVAIESLLYCGPYLLLNIYASHRATGINLTDTTKVVAPIVACCVIATTFTWALAKFNFELAITSILTKLLVFCLAYLSISTLLVKPLPFVQLRVLQSWLTKRRRPN